MKNKKKIVLSVISIVVVLGIIAGSLALYFTRYHKDKNDTEGMAAAKAAYDQGMRKVDVFVRGLGPGRETAIRALQVAGLEIVSITDDTPIPHNGCRPPKRPRG